MPLNASGPISIGGSTAGQSINLEFARTATQTTSMSELYRGGAIVPNASQNAAIPTSGTISLNQFYNATRRIQVTVTIAANQTNYVFNTAKVPGYVAGITDVVFDINSGVIISASSTGVYAGNVDTSWAAGDTVRINNNGGVIVGCGGAGGNGSSNTMLNGTAGASGGPAFIAQRAITFNNGGTIAGGGGGGGGGGAYTNVNGKAEDFYPGGGGGGGRSSAAANSAGGTGGAWGTAGGAGTKSVNGNQNFGPYGGGAGGVSVAGNGNISWVATGTRLGAIT